MTVLDPSMMMVGTVILGAAVLVFFYIFFVSSSSSSKGNNDTGTGDNNDANGEDKKKCESKSSSGHIAINKKQLARSGKRKHVARALQSFEHASALKGFGSPITAIAVTPTGDLCCAAGECRTVMISFGPFSSHQGTAYRIPGLPLDHASAVAFDSDPLGPVQRNGTRAQREPGSSTTLAIAFSNSREIRIYSVSFDLKTKRFDVQLTRSFIAPQRDPIQSLSLHGDRGLIFTCSSSDDLEFHAISLASGSAIGKVSTHQIRNETMAVDPAGRLVAVATFASDVGVWAWDDKEGALKKAMSLRGHSSGVSDVRFSLENRAVTCSAKDHTWRVWGTDVRYEMKEDPLCLFASERYDDPCVIAAADASLEFVAVVFADRVEMFKMGSSDGAPAAASRKGLVAKPIGTAKVMSVKNIIWGGKGTGKCIVVENGSNRATVWDVSKM